MSSRIVLGYRVECAVHKSPLRLTRERAERDLAGIEELGACKLQHTVREVSRWK